MSLPAGTRVGKYVIQRKLAEGGMAEIFLASSFGPEGFEKQIIIKRIRPQFAEDAAFVEMFVAEARLVSRLNHANIVQIFDFDSHEDTFYIAMEYIRGKSLAQAHQRSRELSVPLTPILAAQVVTEVARGLSFAHRLTEHGQPLGLVHRDVTPQNVLLSYEGAVKLTDFGIAKAGTRASTVGVLKGKFSYMSPEQSRGQPVDCRTDIFALGITFWELLSGGRLFDADSDVGVLNAVQERAVMPPEQLNPRVDSSLSAIVMRCLERDKGARFQTAQELERALSRYLATSAAGPEDTDVAAWMHAVFPIEAAQTESTEFRLDGRAGRLATGHTSGPPVTPGSTAARTAPASGPPASVLAPAVSRRSRDTASDLAWDGATARTPIALHDAIEEPSTRRTARPTRRRKPVLLLGGVVAGLLAVGLPLALVLGPKLKPAPPPAPVQAPAPVSETPLPVQPSPPPPAETPVTAEAPKKVASVRHRSPSKPSKAVASPSNGPLPGAPKQTPSAGPGAPSNGSLPGAPKQLPSAAPGTLVLTVSPAGDVYIDGKLQRKQEGKAEYELTVGKHQLEVRGPSNWRKEVVIEPGQKEWQWAYR